mgnify:CR=1 FL=1
MSLVRQQIMDAVKTRLQSITVANGYNFNLGNNIYEWRIRPLAMATLPALVYRDVETDIELIEAHRNRLNIEIEIISNSSIVDIRKMIADVYKAIGVDIQWGGLALNTYPRSDRIMREQEEQTITGAIINIIIEYRTKEWNPYQQL